ncbi:hypothetical protein M407DRAFT_192524 [Tulasnella calospora MUT 4182]|uniref:Uncharacterized protein n=1 Tax=Tulasnella calospora MUT 4182 TaxID=1051891 RepID=A0A0C3MIJ0_9AGAM|nr:hypothetical protein M407DRAFT_192524 [Tulasnella calospora MUT 4182]
MYSTLFRTSVRHVIHRDLEGSSIYRSSCSLSLLVRRTLPIIIRQTHITNQPTRLRRLLTCPFPR